jgi:hypothetical protein
MNDTRELQQKTEKDMDVFIIKVKALNRSYS